MQKYANLVKREKCCQTHILIYFLAKFRFDTAENEPAKNLQILQKKCKIANFAKRDRGREAQEPAAMAQSAFQAMAQMADDEPGCKILAKLRSFSAVSAPIFASKYAF